MEGFSIPQQEIRKEETVQAKLLEQQIIEQSNLIEIKPEDRNMEGKLLVSPEGPVSKLDEQEWKIVRTQAFKEWFGESVVVDENGEPLVLYHGSSKKFDKFDVSKVGVGSGENKDSGYFGTGFYFTPHQGLAEKYGPILYKSFLRVNHIQTFNEEHGNVRFDDNPLPENIKEEVLKRYKPLQEAEYRRLQEQEEKNKLFLERWLSDESNTKEDLTLLLGILNKQQVKGSSIGNNPEEVQKVFINDKGNVVLRTKFKDFEFDASGCTVPEGRNPFNRKSRGGLTYRAEVDYHGDAKHHIGRA